MPAGTIAPEHDLLSVGRPGRLTVVGRIGGQLGLVTSVRVHRPDVARCRSEPGKGNLVVVRRPCGSDVVAWIGGQLDQPTSGRVRRPDVVVAASVTGKGDLAAPVRGAG